MKSDRPLERRNRIVKARISEEEYRIFSQKRKASGLSESEFIRRAIFGMEVLDNNARNQKAMEHICHIHTLLNHSKLKWNDPALDTLQEEVSDLCQCLS